MISKAAFINKTAMKKVNRALKSAGFSEYPGDETSNGRNGSGYVSNLISYIAGQDFDEQSKVLRIVDQVLSN